MSSPAALLALSGIQNVEGMGKGPLERRHVAGTSAESIDRLLDQRAKLGNEDQDLVVGRRGFTPAVASGPRNQLDARISDRGAEAQEGRALA